MRKIYFLISFLSSLHLSAQPSFSWDKTYGGSSYENGSFINTTRSGGYIFIGSTSSLDGDVKNKPEENGTDIWIVELDSIGEIIQQKTLGGTSHDYGGKIYQTPEGGYIAIASPWSDDGDVTGHHRVFSDAWAVKLDSALNIEWNRAYGNIGPNPGREIAFTQDGGYILITTTKGRGGDISGYYGTYPTMEEDIWVARIDSLGNILWEQNYGGIEYDAGLDIIALPDGTFLGLGVTTSTSYDVSVNLGNADIWLFNIDDTGKLLWEKSLGSSNSDRPQEIILTSDNHLVILGTTATPGDQGDSGYGNPDLYILKVNLKGDLIWERRIGGTDTDAPHHLLETSEKEYVITGYSTSTNGDMEGMNNGMFIFSLDQDGNIVWKLDSKGGMPSIDELGGSVQALGIAQGKDKGLVISGNHKNDVYVRKLGGSTYYAEQWYEICKRDSLFLVGDYRKIQGTYYDTTYTAPYEDSIIVNYLIVKDIDTSYILKADTLIPLANNASFQIVNCVTGDSISLAENNFFLLPESGTYLLFVTQNGCTMATDCFSVEVKKEPEETEEPEEPEEPGDPCLQTEFKLYPNPTTGIIKISHPCHDEQEMWVSVYTASGKKILQKNFRFENERSLELSDLQPGAYYLKLEDNIGRIILSEIIIML